MSVREVARTLGVSRGVFEPALTSRGNNSGSRSGEEGFHERRPQQLKSSSIQGGLFGRHVALLNARVLLLKGFNRRQVVDYSDHKKYTVDTILTFPQP